MIDEIQVFDGDGVLHSIPGSWGFDWEVSAEGARQVVTGVRVTLLWNSVILVPINELVQNDRIDLLAHIMDTCDPILRGLSLEAQTAFSSTLRHFLREGMP